MSDGAREHLRSLERALLAALSFGTAVAALYVGRNRLAPVERPLTFALVFWGWSLAFYTAVLVPALVAASALARALGRPGLFRTALGLLAVATLGVCVGPNARALTMLFARLGGPPRFHWLTPAAFLLGVAGLFAAALLPLARPWAGRALALLALLAATGAFLPVAPPRPAAAPPRALRSPAAGERFVLVGADGADWRYLEPLLQRGDLPHLSALRSRGAWGPLKTFVPTASPVIWNTIATGQPPDVHGIWGFTSLRVRGVQYPFPDTRLPKHLGFRTLYGSLQRAGFIFEAPVISTARRAPAFWNIATAMGSPSQVIDWWGTWPAEPLIGDMVSERAYFWRFSARRQRRVFEHLTYPEELYRQIEPDLMPPEQVGFEDARRFMDVTPEEFEAMQRLPFRGKTIAGEFPFLYSMFETDRRLSLRLIERGRRRFGAPPDLLVLFRIVDIASHCSLAASELVDQHLDASEEDQRRFGRVVSEAYRSLDRGIGDIARAFGEANVIVVSDHGFEVETRPGGAVYQHTRAPAGIFLAAGPAFRPGRVDGLTVHDVLPLLAYLKGFPIAADLPGRLHPELFAPGLGDRLPVRRLASYGSRQEVTVAREASEVDDAMLERLRALGYIH